MNREPVLVHLTVVLDCTHGSFHIHSSIHPSTFAASTSPCWRDDQTPQFLFAWYLSC